MIKINKTDAQISISSTPAKQRIAQPPADFEMTQKHVKLEISSEQIKVQIDQRECFNDAWLKDNKTIIADAAARGMSDSAAGIDRIVSEGNMMASIETGANAIAEIAYNNTNQQIDYNIDSIPKSRPQISFTGGTVDIKIDEGSVNINTKPNRPQIDVELGGVEIKLQRKPEISFEYVGSKLDAKI